jgi:hypothetical protein
MKRIKLVGAATVGALALSFTGLAGTAHADLADDLQIMAGNADEATDALVAGIQEAIDVLTTTQSAVDTSAALGDALVAAGSALIAGTEQFGALGLGFGLLNGSLQAALQPFLNAIDDPSTAADVITGDDIAGLLGNLPRAVEALLHGNEVNGGDDDGLVCAVAELLRGNLVAGTGFAAIGTPAVAGCAAIALLGFAVTLTENTGQSDLAGPFLVAALVGPIALADYLQQAEDALAPLFEALSPVTEPVALALNGL